MPNQHTKRKEKEAKAKQRNLAKKQAAKEAAKNSKLPKNRNRKPKVYNPAAKVPAMVKQLEQNWAAWLATMFSSYYTHPFGAHHIEFWEHIWGIEAGVRPMTYVAIWPRGGAKSTSAEHAAVVLGATKKRKYCLYISGTQEQADDHVGNIGALLESDILGALYPAMGARRLTKYGHSRGWRRNRLRTANGFTVDAIGLDTAARGVKLEEDRPDLIIIDDIDEELDTTETTEKKVKTLTRKLLPAGSEDVAIVGIQNLVHKDSIFSQLADGRADFMAQRIVSGPIPAVEGLEVEQAEGRFIITAGKPTWVGQDLDRCQENMDDWGYTAFMSEAQHHVEDPPGGMFDHLIWEHQTFEEVKPFIDYAVCWVDPAITETDRSDRCAIQIDAISVDKQTLYRLYSWEQKATPQAAIKHALQKAQEFGCVWVGIETDQGGDTWESVFHEACRETGIIMPMKAAKAGSIGSKIHRASQMLAGYERGQRIIHVYGTHKTLEGALRRFPKSKPFDLTDAAFWSWWDLTNIEPQDSLMEYEERVHISDY